MSNSNPAMGGLIMNTPNSLKRKNPDTYGHPMPSKKFDFGGKWELQRDEMREFVTTCNIYKTVRLLVPNNASTEIEEAIDELQQGDDCKIIMPSSTTLERNIFVICNKESQDLTSNDQYGPYIEISDFDKEVAENLANVATRIATIITPCIVVNEYTKGLQGKDCEIRMLMHHTLGGRMIGKGGENIKRIREETGCKLTIFTDPCPKSTDMCIQIIGRDEQVYNACVEVILTCRSNSLSRANGPRLFYNADKAVNEGKYGQYTNEIPKPKGSTALAEKASAVTKSVAGGAHRGSQKGDDPNGDCLFRFLIPENIGGRIIGKGGEVVDRIRAKHNVLLKSPNSTSADRIAYIYSHQNLDNKAGVIAGVSEILSIVGDVLKKKSVHLGRQLKKHNPKLNQTKFDVTELNIVCNKTIIEKMVEAGELDKIWRESNSQIRAYVECCPGSTDRVVNVSGTLEEIITATEMVIQKYSSGVYEAEGADVKYMGVVDPNYKKGMHAYGGYIETYGTHHKPMMEGIDYHGTPDYKRADDDSSNQLSSNAYAGNRAVNYSRGGSWKPGGGPERWQGGGSGARGGRGGYNNSYNNSSYQNSGSSGGGSGGYQPRGPPPTGQSGGSGASNGDSYYNSSSTGGGYAPPSSNRWDDSGPGASGGEVNESGSDRERKQTQPGGLFM